MTQNESIATVKLKSKVRLLMSAAVIVLFAFLLLHWKVHHVNMPARLIGTWTTTAPAYTGRTFEIQPETVAFGTGRAGEFTGFITNIETSPDDSGCLYTLSYRVNGSQQQISFYYKKKGKTIRFVHQERIVWVKDGNR